MKLELKHVLLLCCIISGVGTQLMTLHAWSEITPFFIGGMLLQTGASITAIFIGAPGASAAMAMKDQQIASATASSIAASEQPVVIVNQQKP